jgi:hypothetical protein
MRFLQRLEQNEPHFYRVCGVSVGHLYLVGTVKRQYAA